MVRRPPANRPSCLAVAAALGAGLVALAAEPTPEELADRAAAAFTKLDTAPCDGVLAGPEFATVKAYDRDADGRVSPEEFARGYLERKPDVEWRRHDFKREGFSCELPAAPEPLDADGPVSFQVVANVHEGDALFIARVRDMPARAAGKPDPFFDTVVEQLEASGAKVVDRRAANLGLHRGSVVLAVREDGSQEFVRSVVVGRTVYELDAVLSPAAEERGQEMVTRFLGSLRLAR